MIKGAFRGRGARFALLFVLSACGDLVEAPGALVSSDGGTEGTVRARSTPRIVNAVSTGNKSVLVQYNEPMGDSVLDPAHYAIVQEKVNAGAGFVAVNVKADVGFLVVQAVSFVDASHRSVRLTTLSQSEVTYRVKVTNVLTARDEPLGPVEVNAGVQVDPTSRIFAGIAPTAADWTDTDGDGLADHLEQRGWTVAVMAVNGDVEARDVTSDPTLPDSDGDGLTDLEEHALATDPRAPDTDGDRLTDYVEYNHIYTDPTARDSDLDGIDDYLEVSFFHTNALVDDSDGDGFSDADELFTLNRNPRLADLPSPSIQIGEVRLQLDEQYSVTDVNGVTRTEESSSTATLVQSTEQSHAETSSDAQSFLVRAKVAAKLGFEGGTSGGHAHVIGKGEVGARAIASNLA